MLSLFKKNTEKKKKEYSIETYTLIKGVQLESNKQVVTESNVLDLTEPQFITWKYLRGSRTLEDAFSNMNEELNNMISIETFMYVTEELTDLGTVYTSSSETDISKYIESDCKLVINSNLISDVRSKIHLKHLDMEIILTQKEYALLKAITKGEYDSIDMKDWKVFFSLYKKEAISFV